MPSRHHPAPSAPAGHPGTTPDDAHPAPAGGPSSPVRTRDAVRTRAALLSAARTVIARQGTHASLDAVAREAGVSKGGLLHHFPSREALLVGLVEEWLAQYEEAVRSRLEAEPAGRPGRVARAHVRATLDVPATDDGWSAPALMGLLVSTPEVLERARTPRAVWERDLASDGLDAARARVVGLALDGVTLQEMLGHWTDAEERARLRDQLLALTEPEAPGLA